MTLQQPQNNVEFCVSVILKEAKEERRLVKQIFYVMLSMYTNNPINLAINAPTGEGKNYIIKKVAELFPKDDVIFLAGLSERALYHRQGILVVKNEKGEYESIEERLKEIDEKIEGKESEISSTSNTTLKTSLKNDIKELQSEKKDLTKNARNLIDLSNKTLVLLDTPSKGLFNAIMSLLSHDHWEVEYEFADTQATGIKTKTNVLRGWPCVIFAQAIDYSGYNRWAEVQRRFIITNPNMDPMKYNAAIDLMAEKFGNPDIVYQATVVSNEEKDLACGIVGEMKGVLLDLTRTTANHGANNVIIPFNKALNKSLSRSKASDMTLSYRIFSFLALLPQINLYSRCHIQVTDPTRNILFIQRWPIASFEDMKEALYLMEYSDGVRPYVLKWYYEVFLPTFNEKEGPDYKVKYNRKGEEGETVIENIIAVSSEQLRTATECLQDKVLTKKQIRDNYVEPLVNQGYIDMVESELDRRSHIYYPIVKIDNLNVLSQTFNFPQDPKIEVRDFTLFPSKEYVKSRISGVIDRTFEKGYFTKIISSDKREITVEEYAEQYYGNPEEFFFIPKIEIEIENDHERRENEDDDVEMEAMAQKYDPNAFNCDKCGKKLGYSERFQANAHKSICDGPSEQGPDPDPEDQ
jgi:hypothetical protein